MCHDGSQVKVALKSDPMSITGPYSKVMIPAFHFCHLYPFEEHPYVDITLCGGSKDWINIHNNS